MIIEQWGEGETAVLVHGSLATGPEEWEQQKPLAREGYELIVPTRTAYAVRDQGEDFLRDGEEIAELLGHGAHLVGHSYGALGAVVAAHQRPEAVLSLVLAEPPIFDVSDRPEVRDLEASLQKIMGRGSDREFLVEFLRAVGTPIEELDDNTLDDLAELAPILRRARQPWQTSVPVDHLTTADFPVVVVSGDHHPAFSLICEALAERTGARLAAVRGAGHEVQFADGFNDLLRDVWRSAGELRNDPAL